MALPKQLKTARLTDLADGATIDDGLGAAEGSVAEILGIPTNTDIAKAILGSVDSEGRITGKPRIYGAGNAAGIRFRDSGTSKEFLIANASSALKVYENTGTEAIPVWTERWSLDLANGVTAPTVDAYCDIFRSAGQSIPDTTDTSVSWDSDLRDSGDWHDPASNPERITPGVAGVYQVAGYINFGNGSPAAGTGIVYLDVSGGTGTIGMAECDLASGADTVVQFCGGAYLSSVQYVSVRVYQSTGGALSIVGRIQVTRCSG